MQQCLPGAAGLRGWLQRKHHQVPPAAPSCCHRTAASRPGRRNSTRVAVFSPSRPNLNVEAPTHHTVIPEGPEGERVRKQLQQLMRQHFSDRFMSWDSVEEDGSVSLSASVVLESLASCSTDDDARPSTSAPASVTQGFAAARGKKGGPMRPNQDFYVTYNQRSDSSSIDTDELGQLGKPVCISAVYDGHGHGEHAAQLAQDQTLQRLARSQSLISALGSAADLEDFDDEELTSLQDGFAALFKELDMDILRRSREAGHLNGTTALLTVCCGTKIYCSNAGDSRAVLCRDGTALRLSRDHTPALRGERARIESVGGCVVQPPSGFGEPRVMLVNGYVRKLCALSRGLGDRDFKDAGLIVCDPDVSAAVLKPQRDAFMIAASDGLWGRVNDQEAVDAVAHVLQRSHSPMPRHALANLAAAKLVELAQDSGSTDDITVIVNIFDWD